MIKTSDSTIITANIFNKEIIVKGKGAIITFILSVFIIIVFSINAVAVESASDANNLFALDIYNQIKQEEGNLFFSPYSIYAALAMTYAGARENTEKQMAGILHIPSDQKYIHSSLASLNKQLKEIEQKGVLELSIANALWAQKGYTFLPKFIQLNAKYYEAAFEQLDFKTNTEVARKRINSWTEEHTRKKIKDLLPSGALNTVTRLVLTNAIYFKSNWESQFKEFLTSDEPFWTASSTSVQTPTMRQIKEFNYTETDIAQILELPYKGNDLSMVILLPKERDGLSQMENSLALKNLTSLINGLSRREVDVSLPRFKMEWGLNIAETLDKMGMSDAFKYRLADFSGMDGSKELWISSVFHKAFVSVDEQGTEAAAATAVVMKFGAAPGMGKQPVIFRADHPFLFLIKENRTGTILFMGRVATPEQ